MKFSLALFAFVLSAAGSEGAVRAPPINNTALLNIGFVCRWQTHCIRKQERAMERSLKYVRKRGLPAWKIQLCNRNASRKGTRKDWTGFNNCIRNPTLQSPPKRKKVRR